MSQVILLRHGETDLAGSFCGQIDPSLNAAGLRQADQAAAGFASAGVTKIFSSPLLRARQTAARLTEKTGVIAECMPNLCEIAFGDWEGLCWTEIEARWPEESKRWLDEYPFRCAPNGESYGRFCIRVDAALESILSSHCASTVVVAHRGVMLRMLTHRFGYTESWALESTAPYCAKIHL